MGTRAFRPLVTSAVEAMAHYGANRGSGGLGNPGLPIRDNPAGIAEF